MKINKLTNRIMFLSPTVQAGWEPQSLRTDFENLATLGQGSFGVVWKARHKKTGAIYAIKQIKKKGLKNQNLIEHVKVQVKIMYQLNHPNIVKLYNHFEDQFSIYFILEFVVKGELYKNLLKTPNQRYEEKKAAKYIREILQAVQYVHQQKVIHRDIKPENIMLSEDDTVKLADFGWSNFAQKQDKRETYCGTLDYLAPQMVQKSHKHDYRVDIWSIGVLIYELCTGMSPFSMQLLKKNQFSQADVKKNIMKINYAFPEYLSPPCKEIISEILVYNPESRPEISEILSHPWLTQFNIKIEDEKYVDRWLSKLRHEFGVVAEAKEDDTNKYGVFSKEEIYNFSRIESVINTGTKPKKTGEVVLGDKKVRQFQLRIKELQLCNRKQEEELKYLREVKVQNQKLVQELSKLKQTNKQQANKMEVMQARLALYNKSN